MKNMGIPSRVPKNTDQSGEKGSSWKGGRAFAPKPDGHRFFAKSQGYWLVRAEGHPLAQKRGNYVYEHVLVALNAAGLETIPKDHCVHHIDCDKVNNSPNNLIICNRSDHAAYHATLETLVKPLMEQGIIIFDPERGYILK